MLRQEDCYKSITDFYDRIAELNGVDIENVQYDVRKICCTKAVADEMFQFYRDQGHNQGEISALWLCCGPKANLKEDGFVVELEEGFFLM